jgi:hypothetical protein
MGGRQAGATDRRRLLFARGRESCEVSLPCVPKFAQPIFDANGPAISATIGLVPARLAAVHRLVGDLLSDGGAAHKMKGPESSSEPAAIGSFKYVLPIGRSGWAIAAGYLALFAILVLPAPFALGCGILGLRDIARNPKKIGKPRAIFGIVMGSLGSALLMYPLAWRIFH